MKGFKMLQFTCLLLISIILSNLPTAKKNIIWNNIDKISALFVLAVSSSDEIRPVKVDVYYETLCGDSIRFIKDQLWPTYNALRRTGIIEVNMFPYGKANQTKVGDSWTFTCQHKEKECLLNRVEACANYIYESNRPKFMWYAYCLAKDPTLEAAKRCTKHAGMTWGLIAHCYKTRWGFDVQHKVGVATESLNPRLNNVPWVIFNDKFDPRIQELARKEFKELICEAYKGEKPEQCN